MLVKLSIAVCVLLTSTDLLFDSVVSQTPSLRECNCHELHHCIAKTAKYRDSILKTCRYRCKSSLPKNVDQHRAIGCYQVRDTDYDNFQAQMRECVEREAGESCASTMLSSKLAFYHLMWVRLKNHAKAAFRAICDTIWRGNAKTPTVDIADFNQFGVCVQVCFDKMADGRIERDDVDGDIDWRMSFRFRQRHKRQTVSMRAPYDDHFRCGKTLGCQVRSPIIKDSAVLATIGVTCAQEINSLVGFPAQYHLICLGHAVKK